MAQILVPISDTATGGWTPTPCWERIDDNGSTQPTGDGVLATSANNTSGDTLDVRLSVGIDPEVDSSHTIKVRWYRDIVGGHDVHGSIQLWQGVPGVGTLIGGVTFPAPFPTSETDDTFNLPEAFAANIIDYSTLYLRIIREGGTGGGPTTRESLVVEYAELHIPDPPTPKLIGKINQAPIGTLSKVGGQNRALLAKWNQRLIPSTGTGVDLLSDLVTVYEMDETSGTVITDSHGANDATLSGNATINSVGKIDKAAEFYGGDNLGYIELPVALKLTGAFAVSIWFYPDAWTYNSNDRITIFGGEGGSASGRGGIALWHHWTNGVICDCFGPFDAGGNDRKNVVFADTATPGGMWNHIFMTWDGVSTNPLRVWANGVEQVTGTNETFSVLNWDLSTLFRIGGINTSGKSPDFDGRIDQWAIWNAGKGAAEALELYNSGAGLAYSLWS